ncbi:hypothetical protein Droror1_Dr00002631 [Drosera rotundifolia]
MADNTTPNNNVVPAAAGSSSSVSTPTQNLPLQFDSSPPLLETPSGSSGPAKRPRLINTGQWKLVVSSPPPQAQLSPSPTTAAQQAHISSYPMTTSTAAAASSSETTSSPSPSPRPGSSRPGEGQREGDPSPPPTNVAPLQFRKGKYVSPVWKPHEMLWLARAWRVQYQGGSTGPISPDQTTTTSTTTTGSGRGKSRADKDREVAEYLKRHGVNRDAKTAGTKWDNMLGEFRKVYDWERERDNVVAKSYFRLSPYERKIHRLPASFEEDVFEELSQFMGPRLRSSSVATTTLRGVGGGNMLSPGEQHEQHHIGRGGNTSVPIVGFKSLPPPPPPLPPPLRVDDIAQLPQGRGRQLMIANVGEQSYPQTLSGFHDQPQQVEMDVVPTSSTSSSKDLRRIGRARMTWEESVSLWAEESEHHRGRVRVQGSSFLNADEIMFLNDSMVACSLEAFEDGVLKGFSVDRFVSGQQIKVFGRRSSSSARLESAASRPEFTDPTEHYMGRLRVPPSTLPDLSDLSWHIQEPPPEDLRLPLRWDMYRDLPQGKEHFFTTSNDLNLDCRSFTIDILSSLIRSTPSITAPTAMNRDSFIALWDDCINCVIFKFCSVPIVFVRKPSSLSSSSSSESLQEYQWPHLTGLLRNFCLWRGEETDQVREGHIGPSSTIVQKTLWTCEDLPYILGYHAVGQVVTFCALSRSPDQPDRVIRTDLYTVDLSVPAERVKALVPCWRIAGLLALLSDRISTITRTQCISPSFPYSDYDRIDLGNGHIIEMTPDTVTKYYPNKRRYVAVKEIYEYFDNRIPHAEYIWSESEPDLSLTFKPRGYKSKPTSIDQLIEVLKNVTKSLVALHDLSFMHRDLSWDKVLWHSNTSIDHSQEWFLSGLEDAVGAPQLCPHVGTGTVSAPEMGRGVHGVKVDVWGVGMLVRTCGLMRSVVPKLIRELEKRCLEQNPELRPTAAECYHHLVKFQASLAAAAALATDAGGGGGY